MINLITPYKYNNIYVKKTPVQNSKLSGMPKYDTVQFTARSMPSEFGNVFDYLASEIAMRKKTKYNVNGGMLYADKIRQAIIELFERNKVFSKFELAIHEKVKWKNYVPQEVRTNAVDKVNEARIARLNQWQSILDNPQKNLEQKDIILQKKLENNRSLQFVIWEAVTSELKKDNRYIPVPFDAKALLDTIQRYEKILPRDRAVSCAKPSFLEYYTHRLRDNLLMSIGLSKHEEVWVKIPSLKHDPLHKEENINKLEILSNRNWCTRSSIDKAADALDDGDFYVYLKRNSFNMWEPVAGMTSSKGKIDQIQGKDNDNIVPLDLVGEIKSFIQKSGLKCQSGIINEGPKAQQAIFISEKLNEENPLGKTLAQSIKTNDNFSIFEFFGIKAERLKGDKLKIGTYKPTYIMNRDKGQVIPFSMFGLNEDELLANVSIIDGNLILRGNSSLFNSTIRNFPPSLKKVTGKVYCTKQQYERFRTDIERVVGGDKNKIFVSEQ